MKNLLKFPFNVKANHEEGIIEGYASVFNIFDLENDIVLPGAFNGGKMQDVKFLWQHIPEKPIGQILMMHEDSKGLYVKAKLILSVKQAYEAYMLVKDNALNGLSIGYIPISYEDKIKNNKYLRYLKKIDLKEISLVTFPVNKEATVINVKSDTLYKDNLLSNALDKAITTLENLNLNK